MPLWNICYKFHVIIICVECVLMKYLYIVGKKKTGEKFRPSDWSERLSDCLYCFDEAQEINYFNYICTDNYDQTKALKISNELKEIDPIAFNFLLNLQTTII